MKADFTYNVVFGAYDPELNRESLMQPVYDLLSTELPHPLPKIHHNPKNKPFTVVVFNNALRTVELIVRTPKGEPCGNVFYVVGKTEVAADSLLALLNTSSKDYLGHQHATIIPREFESIEVTFKSQPLFIYYSYVPTTEESNAWIITNYQK